MQTTLRCPLKKEAIIDIAMTTIVSATKDLTRVAPCCQDTGLWKLGLAYEVLGREYPDQFTGVYSIICFP